MSETMDLAERIAREAVAAMRGDNEEECVEILCSLISSALAEKRAECGLEAGEDLETLRACHDRLYELGVNAGFPDHWRAEEMAWGLDQIRMAQSEEIAALRRDAERGVA